MALSRTSFSGEDALEVAEVEVAPLQTLLQYPLHSLGSHWWREGEGGREGEGEGEGGRKVEGGREEGRRGEGGR